MRPRSKYQLFTSKKETWEPENAEQVTVKLDPERLDGRGIVVKFEGKVLLRSRWNGNPATTQGGKNFLTLIKTYLKAKEQALE